LRQILCAPLVALLSPLIVFATGIDRIRDLNQRILSDLSSKNARRSAASDTAFRERANLLRAVIADDPAAARDLLLSPGILRDLRNRHAVDGSLIERTFAYTGPVEATVVDLPREKRSVRSYLFESAGETITAHGGPGITLACGDDARLEGFRLGGAMLITAAAVERHAEPAAECRTDGSQRLAVILANNPGAPAPDLTKGRIGELVFGASGRSAVTFYKEASYGQLDLTGDVFGWYTLDRVYKCGEFAQLRTAALKAADTDIDFTRYSRVLVISPSVDGCETLGQGTVGCQALSSPGERFRASYASVVFDDPEELLLTLIHELGHNFGIDHARTMRFPGAAIGPDRALAAFEEYGDLFSVMGGGEAHFSAAQKSSLGWLKPMADYTAVESSGVFDVLPLQSSAPGIKALRVKRNSGSEALWIEYRQPTGVFDRSDLEFTVRCSKAR
jgi:M6 family metalloprotease-like protein